MKTLVTTLLTLSLCSAACGGSSSDRPTPMFVEMPESIEVALLEQNVSELRARLEAMSPDDSRRPQTMIELAREQEMLIYARTQVGATSSPLVDAPEPDYAPVITLYEQVVVEHPGSAAHVRIAMLEAGHLLLEAQRVDEGEGMLTRLIEGHPGTPESHSACLILAERAFIAGRLVEAQTHLGCAGESADVAVADAANYVLGWVAINLGEHERAAELFEALRATSTSEAIVASLDRDLLVVFSFLEDGVTRAIETFGDRPEHLSDLLSLYLDMAHPSFPVLADYLLSTYPDHELAAQWCAESTAFAEQMGRSYENEACAAE